ncbi:MAG: DUF4037 domain-containing protein [Candidatus Micrarchaeota archaeon]|nr:DUF4037 domain-containing protein [Candidatus Micrarchaeota archaeon]
MVRFVKGLKLNELFYRQAVRPILRSEFPNLKYAAALIGYGSDVLGYDDKLSMTHMWGPRVSIFLKENDFKRYKNKILSSMSKNLPYEILGVPTNYSKGFVMRDKALGREGKKIVINSIEAKASGMVNHHVHVETVKDYFETHLLLNPHKEPSFRDWLAIPQQKLLEITSGKVFHDGIGDLTKVRAKFNYYPRDIWLYMLATQWLKITQEGTFVGRAAGAGDELGSAFAASKMVKYLMELSFLMERKYMPYGKWFGRAFKDLEISAKLSPILSRVYEAKDYKTRERSLSKAYGIVAKKHNQLKITKPLDTSVYPQSKHKPYLIPHGDFFYFETLKHIKSAKIRGLPPIGAINQFIDNTDFMENPKLVNETKRIFGL